MNRLIFFIGMTCSWATYAAPSAEDIFADARAYTVYIETRIEIPFIEDEQGASMGAGFVVDRKHRWLLTKTHKGQVLVSRYGETTARYVVWLLCLLGIAFGSLLASGLVRPIAW